MKLQPIQIPARPRGLRFKVDALVDPRFEIHAETAVIDLFDSVTSDTPALIAGALRQFAGRSFVLRVNSPGGDAFSGMAAFNLIAGYSGNVNVEILGIAASAASIIAMSGDKIQIAAGAQIMIHRGTGGALGNADDMRTVAEALDRVDAAMAGVYQARTGLPLAQVTDLMRSETFMNADEAVQWGFADSVLANQSGVAPPRVAASTKPASKRELEEQFRKLGFSRAIAADMTNAAWPATRQIDSAESESDLDFDAIVKAITDGVTSAIPKRRIR